jgi:AraC-like DNA-binding protein
MLYLSGIVLAFFLSFLLITKRSKTPADYVLVAWLSITGFHLITFYLFYTNQETLYPTIVVLGIPLPLAQGPFLYLYTSLQTAAVPFRKKQLLHFLPLLLSYMLFVQFFFLTFSQKVEVFRLKGQGFETQIVFNSYAIYISGIVYISLSLIRLLRYRKNLVDQFSNTDKINFNWLLYLIIWMVTIWIVILLVKEDKLVFGAAALFVLWLGYFGIRQVQLFYHNTPQPPLAQSIVAHIPEISPAETVASTPNNLLPLPESNNEKYQKSTLSDQDASLIHERLKVLLTEQKLFTNPDLTLNDLAKSLEVHPNHLSQVINSKEKKSFYDLVNEKRVEEFIRLMAQPAQQQYTLMSVAYDCGFNSKASFNRNFKKYTGLTPTDYLKTAGKQVA